MLEAIVRRPATVGEISADALRLMAVLSLAAAMIWLDPVDVALLLLVLLGLLITRSLRLAPAPDIASAAILLVAAWSSITDLYAALPWWDFIVHAAATGVLSGISHLLVTHASQAASPASSRRVGYQAGARWGATLYLITAQGLALSVLWEFGEWWGHHFVDAAINVGYSDTLGDLAAGALGAFVCGALMVWRGTYAPHECVVGQPGTK